ncbi:Oidioi.mRNA.OKI2018_I69.chr2.g8225.t1.cds [Oikopleura dioica]|uniref:Oidioi.mRNA.OKI2018_I69.chr2.g8225.t1.cds n=1 Tax=Oikopleura dioica TaxID=34765 RepID=A0ABN7TF18_OIKDI|nr:Oidioi.mRNA.OKI2018_I69.chr2.g8225.t1.cds [Oikopleura dioica]
MGGASGLNILQQKSWHVLRRHNIERVRKDQREERERQQKEDDRKNLVEFESKLDRLRAKASKSDSTAVATTSSNEPLNLFKVTDLKDLKNVDKQIEDQQDEDKRLRKEGFLTYLGETVLENDSPWYATQRGVEQTKKAKDEERFAKDEIRKTNEDPLAKFAKEMKWAAPKKKDDLIPLRAPEDNFLRIAYEEEVKREKLSFSPPRQERSPSPEFISESRSKKKKSKKSRRESPRRRKTSIRPTEPSSSSSSSSSASLIAMLRAKADKRIQRERAKTQDLFDKINGVVKKEPEEPVEEMDERKRGYNSCFNPKFQAAKERRRNSEY